MIEIGTRVPRIRDSKAVMWSLKARQSCTCAGDRATPGAGTGTASKAAPRLYIRIRNPPTART